MTNPNDLISARRGDWDNLTGLLKHARRGGIRGMSESELVQLGDLYRSATADLALVQRDFPTHALAPYLNRLVGQAHGLIYQDEPMTTRRLRDFYLRVYPRLCPGRGSPRSSSSSFARWLASSTSLTARSENRV